METIDTHKFRDNLRRFTGSSQVFQHLMGDYTMMLTEGIKYVAEKGHAWWLLDLITSYQFQPLVYREKFQRWVLKKHSDDTWTINCTDGNGKALATQHIPYSDFPFHRGLWHTEHPIQLNFLNSIRRDNSLI
jgi:hypothetical protein